MAIEESLDKVNVSWSAASDADRKIPGQMRVGASGEGGDLFVSNVHPFNFALAPNGVCETIEAVADKPVYTLDPRCNEELDKLICDYPWHICALLHCVNGR
jgi:hypothetical protein